jgi:hypothetical protein
LLQPTQALIKARSRLATSNYTRSAPNHCGAFFYSIFVRINHGNTEYTPGSQPSPLGADSGNPLAEDIDTSFDNATQTPPARGWSDSQQATLDEIEHLESLQNSGNISPGQQLRLLELKVQFLGQVGAITPAQLKKVSAQINDLQARLDVCMSASQTDPNALSELLSDLKDIGVTTEGSPLAQKHEALTANPNLSLESRLRFTAAHEQQMADSYADGSSERTMHLNRVSYLTDVADKLKYSEGSLGTMNMEDLEKINFADLKALDPTTLRAEADLFKELATRREAELRELYAEQGLSAEEIDIKIADDPLLGYFNARSEIATKAATALDGDVSPMDRVRIGTDYFADVAKADDVFYTDMATLAAANKDDTNKALYESKASEARDRLGVINRIAQTLISMLAQVSTDAARG